MHPAGASGTSHRSRQVGFTLVIVFVAFSEGILSTRYLVRVAHFIVTSIPHNKHPSHILRRHPHLHAHIQSIRLPQEALPGRHDILMQLKVIPPKHRAYNQRQLHLRDVPAHARPRSIAERNKRRLLAIRQAVRLPALWHKGICVAAPYFFGVVN